MSIARCACETHGQLWTNTVPLKDSPHPRAFSILINVQGWGQRYTQKYPPALYMAHTHTHTQTHTHYCQKVEQNEWRSTKPNVRLWIEGRGREPILSTGFRVSDASHRLIQRTEMRKNSNKLFCSPVRIYCHWVQVTSLLLILLLCRVYESQTSPLKAVLAPLNTQLLGHPQRPEETQGWEFRYARSCQGERRRRKAVCHLSHKDRRCWHSSPVNLAYSCSYWSI